jgi:hypothetical protein
MADIWAKIVVLGLAVCAVFAFSQLAASTLRYSKDKAALRVHNFSPLPQNSESSGVLCSAASARDEGPLLICLGSEAEALGFGGFDFLSRSCGCGPEKWQANAEIKQIVVGK